MKNLYNQDGSLCSEAQILLLGKPDDMSIGKWVSVGKLFVKQLNTKDKKEFKRLKRKQSSARYRVNQPEKVKKYRAKWRANNPKQMKETNKNWLANNPEKRKEYNARSYTKDPKKNIKRSLKWRYGRLKNDPLFRFFHTLRNTCRRVVKQISLGNKPTTTFKWIGCSAEQLKSYFESLFLEGMSWDNYGTWHVDHIRPISSFKAEEWEQINHYTNLQPLWAKDNITKGDSWFDDQSKTSIK
jgi:hypothetical protein